jgi:hypothetical protein
MDCSVDACLACVVLYFKRPLTPLDLTNHPFTHETQNAHTHAHTQLTHTGRKTIQIGIQTARGTGLSIKQYCGEHPSILMFLANATIHAECAQKDFGTMGVYSPYGSLFMCPPPPPPPQDGN